MQVYHEDKILHLDSLPQDSTFKYRTILPRCIMIISTGNARHRYAPMLWAYIQSISL